MVVAAYGGAIDNDGFSATRDCALGSGSVAYWAAKQDTRREPSQIPAPSLNSISTSKGSAALASAKAFMS